MLRSQSVSRWLLGRVGAASPAGRSALVLGALLVPSLRAQDSGSVPPWLQQNWLPLVAGLILVFLSLLLFRRRRESSEGRLQALTSRVKIYLKNRNPEAAVRVLEEYAKEVPELPLELSLLLVEALYGSNQDDRGDQLLAGLDRSTLEVKPRYELARMLEKACRRELAEEVYKEVLREDPDYADVKIRLERMRGAAAGGAGLLSLTYDPGSISSHLSNRYLKMTLIGKGGMGFVFKAFDQKRRRSVALKALSPFLAEEEEAMQRFMREAKILSQFEHPNVVKIFDVEEKPLVFYTMEFLEGRTLGHRLEEEGPLTVRELLDLAEALLHGLAHIHKHGVVHRDIKPENVLLDTDGTPRFTDFGLAVGDQATRITQAGQVMGTLRYMAPEQLRGEEVGFQSDLFSLGVTLYEAATGIHAFSGEDRVNRKLTGRLSEVTDRSFPPGLVALVEMLMEPSPEDRIQTAGEALTMVRSLRQVALRKGPATFLAETRLLRVRVLEPLTGFFSGLAAETRESCQEFFQESSNLRDLKLLIWRLNESMGRIQGAGKPPPESDPRPWARETGKLRTDLARFVRHLELENIESLTQRLRRLEWQLDEFLAPFHLHLRETLFEELEKEFVGRVLFEVPGVDLAVYGALDLASIQEELRDMLRVAIEAAGDGLKQLSLRVQEGAEGERWQIHLLGEGIDKGHDRVEPRIQELGGEVKLPRDGELRLWLPFLLEDRPIREKARARYRRSSPTPSGGSLSSKALEDPATETDSSDGFRLQMDSDSRPGLPLDLEISEAAEPIDN